MMFVYMSVQNARMSEKQIKLGPAPIGVELYILRKRTGESLREDQNI
jgi:hypothetical protein